MERYVGVGFEVLSVKKKKKKEKTRLEQRLASRKGRRSLDIHITRSIQPWGTHSTLSLLRLHQQGMRIDVRSLRQDVQEAKAEEYATTLERAGQRDTQHQVSSESTCKARRRTYRDSSYRKRVVVAARSSRAEPFGG